MGRKTGARLPGFCLNRIRPHVFIRSPPLQSSKPGINSTTAIKRSGDSFDSKSEVDPIETDGEAENASQSNPDVDSSKTDTTIENSRKVEADKPSEGVEPGMVIGKKIMVVIDSSIEAKGALQWALSHSVQNQDEVILLHVTKPSNQGKESGKEIAPRVQKLVCSLKNICHIKKPEVKVEVAIVEGNEKGPTILEEAKTRGVGLLVLGQKKQSTTWRLLMIWAGKSLAGGVVEYCIQNATCMAVAVRRKSKKLGGYMITTKRQRDFWLLA